MATIRLIPPRGIPPYLNLDGLSIQISPDGSYSVDAKYAISLLLQGYLLAPDDVLTGTMASLVGLPVVPGFSFFETTLNKPIWRNVANSAWLDATGAVVG